MDQKPTYRIPEFLLRDSEDGKPLSDADIREIEGIWTAADSFSYPKTDTDQAWNTFRAGIQTEMKVVKRPNRFAMFRWVAAAVVVLTVGIGVWQYNNGQSSSYTALLQSGVSKMTQQLPDGSSVQLNSESVLEVKAIDDNNRTLELKSGEVFFSVAHSEIPFRVITDKGIITVKGTEFNIRHNQGQPFSLYLKNGSVQFETNTQKVTLNPGDMLEENKSGDLVLRKINDNRAYAWTSGKLIFENASVSEVVKGLEDLYKVSFIYDQHLSNEKLTITFDNLSAAHAAELLSKTLNSKVEIK